MTRIDSQGKAYIKTLGKDNEQLGIYKTWTGSGSSGNLSWEYKASQHDNIVHVTVKMTLSSPTIAPGSGNNVTDSNTTPPGNLTSLVNFDAGNQQQTNILYTTNRAFNLYTYYTDGTSTAAQSTPAGTYYGSFTFELGV